MNDRAHSLLQEIGSEAVAAISQEWTELQIVAEIDEDLSLFDAWFVTDRNEKQMLDVSPKLAACFEELRNLDVMSQKGFWNRCTYSLNRSGKFSTNFSYDENPRFSK